MNSKTLGTKLTLAWYVLSKNIVKQGI